MACHICPSIFQKRLLPKIEQRILKLTTALEKMTECRSYLDAFVKSRFCMFKNSHKINILEQ